jgi:hypothetical protein
MLIQSDSMSGIVRSSRGCGVLRRSGRVEFEEIDREGGKGIGCFIFFSFYSAVFFFFRWFFMGRSFFFHFVYGFFFVCC